MSHTRATRTIGLGGAMGMAVIALVIGAAGTAIIVPGLLTGPGGAETAGPSPTSDAEQWYTCGMHRQVIQKGPGECPICHMRLTPMKAAPGAEPTPAERTVLYWRAPMDPAYTSDQPGKSPMGMDLVPVYADQVDSGSQITIDPVTVQNMGVRTAVLRRSPLVRTIRTVGRVDYDEQQVTFINTKFDGWIETLHVNKTGQQVAKGQPLFDVYSPQLYSAQEEYLAAIRGLDALSGASKEVRRQSQQLLDAARIKLAYLDVSDEQIAALASDKRIAKTLTIHSPATGVVVDKMAIEGMYIKPGMQLYSLADLSRVWVYVDIYEYQLPWVRMGQTATMTLPYIPGKQFVGKVIYVYPYLDKQTRVIKVRLEFENPAGELRPDMYATVAIAADLQRDGLLIPREAYIDSGVRKVAFVALDQGRFQPRDIQVGVEAEDGMVEVLYGLAAGERVVTSGQFLLDAESKLKEAVAKMLAAKTESVPAEDHGHAARPASPTMPPGTRYACPMEAHPDSEDPTERGPYFATETGRCPWCGMPLKVIESLDWTGKYTTQGPTTGPATQPIALAETSFVCPMHPLTVRRDTPGTCPICSMRLVPASQLVPTVAPRQLVLRELDHITEHYLSLHRAMAADTTADVARNAHAVAAAADEMLRRLPDAELPSRDHITAAAEQVRAAALRINGNVLATDRQVFAELGDAMTAMLEYIRSDRDRWPTLSIFHCPLTKGLWIQADNEIANPFYGAANPKCGTLTATK